jgi:hypothetical protein
LLTTTAAIVVEMITKTEIKLGFENPSSFCFTKGSGELGETRAEVLK